MTRLRVSVSSGASRGVAFSVDGRSYLRYEVWVTPHLIEGFVKTVRASEVETWAGYGWVVVGTYQDTILKMVTELVDSPLGSSIHSGQSYQDANGLWQSVPMGKVAVIKQLPETVTFFVLQKDTESALADMSAKLKASNEVLNAKLAEAAKKIAQTSTRARDEGTLENHKRMVRPTNTLLRRGRVFTATSASLGGAKNL